MNLNQLTNEPRLLLEANLAPIAGGRFQPTGFADLGAAEYKLPDERGTRMLLVESAQSVANRLERTCLDGDGPEIDPALEGLPYVAGELTGAPEGTIRTSSLLEAHRLGSPYFLLNKEFKAKLTAEMAYNPKRLLNWKKIYATLFRYDPNSLVHGVFLSLLEGGRVRTPRAVTGFIEARDIERVVSGGVKNSPLDPKGELQVADEKADKGVYSNVPYARVEYVAREIKAYFNIDLALIRGYGLGAEATELLTALSLLKTRRFLGAQLRLRTACDLKLLGDVGATAPAGFWVPPEETLLEVVQRGINACAPLFAEPRVTVIKTPVKVVKSKDAGSEQTSTGSA